MVYSFYVFIFFLCVLLANVIESPLLLENPYLAFWFGNNNLSFSIRNFIFVVVVVVVVLLLYKSNNSKEKNNL